MRTVTTLRHIVVLPALCWDQRRRDFYAVTADVSAEGIRFRSSALLAAGEDLTCSIRHVGMVEARITRAAGQEFVVRARGGRTRIVGLARELVSLARAQGPRVEPLRGHRRIVPVAQAVAITFENGVSVPGQVLDISASGAALRIDRQPEVGATIRVGAKAARVARHFAGGIRVAFMEPFEPGAVDAAIIL